MSNYPSNPGIACSAITKHVVVTGTPNKPASDATLWINPFPYAIFIYKGYVWVGVSKGDQGDVSFFLADPRYFYVNTNDDHYGDRTGISNNDKPFDCTPARYILYPNEALTLSTTANCDAGTPSLTVDTFAFFNYVT